VAAIIARAGVIARVNGRDAQRQVGVGGERGAAAGADVGAGEVPAYPIGLAQGVAVIHGLDGALDQEMVVVGGVGRGAAGIAQLHLPGSGNDGASPEVTRTRTCVGTAF
jgi:hypothetical protein